MPPPTDFQPPAFHPSGDGFGGPGGNIGQPPPMYIPPGQPYVAMGEPTQ